MNNALTSVATRGLTAAALLVFGGCVTPEPATTQPATPAPPATNATTASAPRLLPDVRQIELPNGATLQLAVKDDVPLVALSARLRGGAVADPPGKGGLASLTARLLEKGAGQRNARELAVTVADVGGQLSTGSGLESSSIGAEFLAEDTDLMIELVLDMLMSPTFDQDEFERARTRAIASMKAARDGDPRSLISRYGRAFLFGDHPYGRPTGGTETSLAALTRDDVVQHHRAHFGPDRLIMSIVGDIDPDKVRKAVEARLADWPAASEPAPSVPAPTSGPGRRVLLVNKPDATQTYFWIGSLGVAQSYPEEASLDVANTLFGGRFTSMLNTALRVESGLTYGASCRLMRPTQPGSVAIVSFTATDNTAAAMDLALATLDRFTTAAADDAQLDSAKTYIRGQNPLGYETASQVAGQLTSLAFYGQDRSVIDGYDAAVAAVDLDSYAGTVGEVYPAREDLVTVVIGDGDAIRETMASYGEVIEMSIKTPAFRPAAPQAGRAVQPDGRHVAP